MKLRKKLRTLEELWDLEDAYPLNNSNPAGLLRWMYATGTTGKSPVQKRPGTHRNLPPKRSQKSVLHS